MTSQNRKNTLYFQAEDPNEELEKISLIDIGCIHPLFYNHNHSPIGYDIYLHGICGIFALALHEVFHYEIYVLAEENVDGLPWPDRLIHIYCKADDFLLDVRGATVDEEVFFDEFSDFMTKYSEIFPIDSNSIRDMITQEMSTEEFTAFYNKALEYIEQHHSEFEI